MNHPKNPEEAIDRVLAALRAVEAPQNMERRILDKMQSRAIAQDKPASVLAPLFGRSRQWAIAGSVLMLSLAAWMAVHKRHEAGHEVVNLAPSTTTKYVSEASTKPARKTPAAVSPHRKSPANPKVLSDEDALAISEMNAPSKPAPPLPLTSQEKLLAGAVHQANPVELSSLRPEVRARQMELSKAEFHDFFEPPPVKGSE